MKSLDIDLSNIDLSTETLTQILIITQLTVLLILLPLCFLVAKKYLREKREEVSDAKSLE